MKQPKRMTREQKILLSSEGLDPRAYFVWQDLPHSLIVIHKESRNAVTIIK